MIRALRLDRLLANDRWIPALIIGFFIGLAMLEGYFIYLAASSYRGLVTDTPYQQGMSYAEVLAEDAAQARRGWQTEVTYEGAAGASSDLSIAVFTPDGQPLADAKVSVLAERVTRHPQIIASVLGEQAPGRYVGALRFSIGGEWTLRITVEKGAERDRRVVKIDVKAGETEL